MKIKELTKAETKAEGLMYIKLRVPKEVIFPDKVQFSFKPNTDELKSVTDYLEKNFSAWLEALQAMPTTEQERKERKKELTKLIIIQNERGVKLSTPENYVLNVADGKRDISAWDDYSLDMAAYCKRESINILEVLISETNPIRITLIELYQSYIDKIKNDLLNPILKAGNYDHAKVFQNLVDNNIILNGDFNSWKSYFVGTDYSNRKKITIDVKKRTEFLYFIEMYCPNFKDGTRKIKELNDIVILSDGSMFDSNNYKTTNITKIKKIMSFLL